jgi:hypothetical protein
MWKILLLSLVLSSPAIAQLRGPIVWGTNNNALYLPSNKPLVGNACLTVDPLGVISPQTCGGGGGSGGTVTSVNWGVTPSWLVGLGGPITTSGALGLAVPSQAPNLFLASPNGVAGTLSPRAIVAADIPTLNQNTTGSAGSLSSIFASGQPLIGNGSGIPALGTKTGLTNNFVTSQGSWTAGEGVKIGLNGDLIATGVPVDQAAGLDKSVQYKGADGIFHGDSYFRYDYNTQSLYVNDVYLAQGQNKPAGFSNENRIEPWERTGNKKTLVNTDANPLKPGFCYVFDVDGNFVSSGTICTPVTVDYPVVVTGDFTVTTTSTFIIANCATDCTITLPDVSVTDGFKVGFKNIGPANAILHNQIGQQIDGEDDWGLLPDKSQINVLSSGGQWYVY